MNRRLFLQRSLSSSALISLGPLGRAARLLEAGNPKSTIGYIRNDAPPVDVPAYRGECYEDLVPDTLDIAERAKLGVHVLTAITDPSADYQIFWAINLRRNPPTMQHEFDDYHVQVVEGFLESLPLLRIASGSDFMPEIDQIWTRNFLKCIGPDRMFYLPLVGGPWERPKPTGGGGVWRANGTTTDAGDPSVTQITSGQIAARCLGTMSVYYLRDQNPIWKQTAEGMIQRLSQLVVAKDNYCYLPNGSLEPNASYVANAQMPLGLDAIEITGRLSQGLAQYYRISGYEPALALAKRLSTFFRSHSGSFDDQGRFVWADSDRGSLGWGYNAKYEVIGGHAHGRAIGLLSMLEYATEAGDTDTAQFVKSSFEWAKSQQDSPFGVSTLVGWFPEWYYPEYPSCEGCMAADMVALAVKLSVHGLGDYWDEVDRWVRNDFAEQQLTSTEWVYRSTEHLPKQPVPPHAVSDQTAERNVGAFAGWSSGNDWVVNGGIMHCCTGNGTRAIYYVWQNMLEEDHGRLKLNLLLNRASSSADVYSQLPYSGKVEIKIKKPISSLEVRAPEWIQPGSPAFTCKRNGASTTVRWNNRYAETGAAGPGDRVTLEFPVPKRTVTERIGPEKYSLVVQGNTVMSIDPPGKNGPLYTGRLLNSGEEMRWRKVNRFVSNETIKW